MATAQSTSLLSRTRSGRLPSGASAGHDVTARATDPVSPLSSIPLPTPSVAVFLTNLRLLDLDCRPDWPPLSPRLFAARDKDAAHGQKRRIQAVEWALYHLFVLWDPDEARAKMQPVFPPADQVQSVALRAAFLRGLEAAKKAGALGRDAVLRKTMLDECRGERFEEILAVFSSAVLRKVVAGDLPHDDRTVARALALASRSHAAEQAPLLHTLILAHQASLGRTLRQKDAARARYRDLAELLALKERGLARRRAAEDALDALDVQPSERVSDDVQRRVQRLVRNNWSGSEAWMNTLLLGDEQTCQDGLLSAPPDRVWRRVRAGRLGELEGRNDRGLLDQLDRRVAAQRSRLHQWHEYSRHVLGSTAAAQHEHVPEAIPAKKTGTGIDLGLVAHTGLYPTAQPPPGETFVPPPHEDYAPLLENFQADLAGVHEPQSGTTQLALFLDRTRMAEAQANRTTAEEPVPEHVESDISDMEEHPIVQQQQQPPPLSAPPSEDGASPTRRRVLLSKASRTFSVQSYDSDDEPAPPAEFLPPTLQRAATAPVDLPRPATVSQRSAQRSVLPSVPTDKPLALRRRQTSPPIRPPRAATQPVPPPAPQTPSPDRSPPPPTPSSDGDGSFAAPTTSPTQKLADHILASMDGASPSPVKRPRHTLSLAERTRMSMARASRGVGGPRPMESDDDESANDDMDDERAVCRPARGSCADPKAENQTTTDDLMARTRKSMAGRTAAQQTARPPLDGRRSQRKPGRPSAAAAAAVSSRTAVSGRAAAARGRPFLRVDEDDGDAAEDTTMLAEELMAGQQDDAEAIFRSRPKIKLSPLASPARELEVELGP